jgi:hypothetical protein
MMAPFEATLNCIQTVLLTLVKKMALIMSFVECLAINHPMWRRLYAPAMAGPMLPVFSSIIPFSRHEKYQNRGDRIRINLRECITRPMMII